MSPWRKLIDENAVTPAGLNSNLQQLQRTQLSNARSDFEGYRPNQSPANGSYTEQGYNLSKNRIDNEVLMRALSVALQNMSDPHGPYNKSPWIKGK
jgi:hypothetical protein